MRKTLAIALISIHLTGTTELGQLMHIPQLLTHFFQHHRINPDINFIDFITMHYAGDDGTTADDDIDNKLPFHNTNNNTVTIIYSPMTCGAIINNIDIRKTKSYNSHLPTEITSAFISQILQPPRVA